MNIPREFHPMHHLKSPAPSRLRVVIYARYSSDNQRDASIEDQIRICQAHAEREGWQVIGCYTDHAISGATVLRPGYQALMSAVRVGQCDMVLSESLDRLSRDQEHIAGFHKAAQFAGVSILTLAEGPIGELQIGFKGTMGAMYLKDLADKTRRGLEGRVRQGRSGGGLCYGYRVIRGPVDRHGEAERGLRAIEPGEAAIVRRIFEEFAGGDGPIAITKRLNAEGVAGPRGGAWTDGALRGHAKAQTGILRNELYAGRIVWNRRRWLKDPETGRRVARHNNDSALVFEDVPDLRIISPDLWERAQRRLEQAARPRTVVAHGAGAMTDQLWQHRRPKTLLSGKVFCAACGGSYVTSGKDYMACKATIRQGTCDNKVRVRRTRLEGQVMQALTHELMQPDMVAVFVEEFTAEWNRLAAGSNAEHEIRQRELEKVTRKLEGLIEAIADGLRAPGLQGRLDELSSRRAALQQDIANLATRSSVPRLHPNLAGTYRARVSTLMSSLESDGSRGVLEASRALIARVEVSATGGIELLGELSALLRASGVEGVFGPQNGKSPSLVGDGLLGTCGSSLVDAGTGFEPVTFRL
jgi:site-specific DNA recombinase